MARINAIDPTQAAGQARLLLDAVKAHLGITSNLVKTMAVAPAALEGLLQLDASLQAGVLDAPFREQIALAVAQVNACEYCLSAHCVLGARAGLNPDAIAGSRIARATGAKREAGLKFAQTVVVQRGEVSDAAFATVRKAGYSDAEIVEIVANVALNVFTNYFNLVAQTDIDFPRVGLDLARV